MKYAKSKKTGMLHVLTPDRQRNTADWEVVTASKKASKEPAAPKPSSTRKAKAAAPATEGNETDPGSVVDDLADQ